MSDDISELINSYIEQNDPEPVDVLSGTLGVVVNMIGPNLKVGDDPVEFEFVGDDSTKCVVTIEVKDATS